MRQVNAFPMRNGLVYRMIAVLAICGCTSPLFRAQSPDVEDVLQVAETPAESGPRLVGDLAVPWNTNYLKVEGVAFVTQLDGTGSDPPPSALREQLIKEMQTHDVKNAVRALASSDTAMVMVRGFIPPGAEKGDTFDMEVRIVPRSQTTSLRGGWLMQTRLRELQVLDNSLHSGHVIALAQGPILVDALFDTADDKVLETRGRVLSGGAVLRPRQLGLVIREEHSSVRTSTLLGAAINDRFHGFDRGIKSGVAKPTRDNLIEINIHPRYKHNIGRYLRVIGNIAIGESSADRFVRMNMLAGMLIEPTSAESAALQLEACGEDAIPMLKKGLQADDPEARFYAAEALAYLDDSEAASKLFEIARDERALRWRALTALAVLDQIVAEERLVELMNVASAETRYGAFYALRVRNPHDPILRGQWLGSELLHHVVGTTGDPMIHFSRMKRPEVVIFGHDLRMKPPTFLFAGKDILIKGVSEEQVKVSRFRPGKETEHVVCSTQVDEIVRAIVHLGGGYADVLTAMLAAKEKQYLTCRIELDSMPRPGRTYHREETVAEEEPGESSFRVTSPIPDMFFDRLSRQHGQPDEVPSKLDLDTPEETRTREGFFGRMTSWFSD